MRIARRVLLGQFGGVVHEMWRCHNRQSLVFESKLKDLFLWSLKNNLKSEKLEGQIQLQAFCLMDNHGHQIIRYSGKSTYLSKFLQMAHSEFGRRFNSLLKRSGTYNNGRPKTVVVQETEANQMRAQMYVEANPIRANKFKFENLRFYRHSCFAFYAFGIVNEFTDMLSPPQWYINLGDRPDLRQQRYRSLLKKYLGEAESGVSGILRRFFGASEWVKRKKEELRTTGKESDVGLPGAALVLSRP